jgi:hypothetical protein
MRCPASPDDRPERRISPFRRARFEQLKADLLRRLDRVCAHLPAHERDALATEMTRLRVRVDYGWRGG